jgi:hypothetical protein
MKTHRDTNYDALELPLNASNWGQTSQYAQLAIGSNETHQLGDTASYDDLGTRVYPIIMYWGPQRNVTNDASPQVEMACVKSGTTVGQSEVPGTASTFARLSGWAWGLVVLAMVV